MDWQEVRRQYPHQWIVVEAVGATSENGRRVLDSLAVFAAYPDGIRAIQGQARWQRRYPQREFYFLHTDHESPDILDSGGVRLGPLP